MMKAFKKTVAALGCAALLTTTLAMPASAASYKLVYYTLYNKKTNQPVKGYAVYNKTLYYDAIEAVGLKTYKGVMYHNGNLYSGVQQNKRYVDGVPLTGMYAEKYFKDGVAANGTHDGVLYKNGKKFTGVIDTLRYVDGVLLTGLHTDSGKYFINGVAANGTFDGVYYRNGKPFTGKENELRYVDGVLLTGIHADSGKYFVNGVVANGVYNGIQYINGIER